MKIYSAQHRAIVEAPIMDEPSALNYADCLRTNKDLLEFHKDTEAYNEWLSSYPPIPAVPQLQRLLRDGQEVKEGIDYKIGEKWEHKACWGEKKIKVAIPIKQQVSEEDKEPLLKQEGEAEIDHEFYIGELHSLDSFLKGHGFASWSYTRLAVAVAIKWQSQLSEALAKIKSQEAEIAVLTQTT